MSIDGQTIKGLIEKELATVSDSRVVSHVRSVLIEPYVILRTWDYGKEGQQYPCWMVLDDKKRSGAEIAYCEFGFGPKAPWGLVASGDAPEDHHMGMDSGWFTSFLDAFFDSRASIELPIWRVFKEQADRTRVPLTAENTWESTWKHIEELRAADPKGRYHCSHSI